jgi:hypothetical protein
MMDDSTKRAIDSYENEARFRAVAQSIVARVMQDHGRVDPERADEDAYRIAVNVAALLLQRVYEDVPELAAMRVKRDHYKKIAENALLTRPPNFTVFANSQ